MHITYLRCIYFFEKVMGKGMQKEILHPVVHSPDGRIVQEWAMPKLGTNSLGLPCGCWSPATCAMFCCFPRNMSRELDC